MDMYFLIFYEKLKGQAEWVHIFRQQRLPRKQKSEIGGFAFEPTNLAFGFISRDFSQGILKKCSSNLYHCYCTIVIRVQRHLVHTKNEHFNYFNSLKGLRGGCISPGTPKPIVQTKTKIAREKDACLHPPPRYNA